MKKLKVILPILILIFLLVGCKQSEESKIPDGAIDATEHGVSTENSGEENSQNLQKLIDELSAEGGTIYIPAGEYIFAENGRQTIGSHCIKMRSNVSIVGAGEDTVLRPCGESGYGLDMFYFNDYLDTGEGIYLENCRFESFTINAIDTSCEVYTSAGKGFMFNLFSNCHWDSVTVKYTDATGFGVDCPINSSIKNCIAIGCGKAATEQNGGASGFGIGFGYADGENITISGCVSQGNKKFGYFFEHQGRFNSIKYTATESHEFRVSDCTASGNLYNFGGIYAMNTEYTNCASEGARKHGFYFESSLDSGAVKCASSGESEAAFAISQLGEYEVRGIYFAECSAVDSPIGVNVTGEGTALMAENSVSNCTFASITDFAVYISGRMQSLSLSANTSDMKVCSFGAEVENFKNDDNSWN